MFSISSRSVFKRSFVSQRHPRFYSSTVHDNDPQILELEKQRNLTRKQHLTSTPISEAPGWNEHLASTSEAHIKADKSEDSLSALVSKTVKYVQSRHSPEERVGSREATYERDSVEGPLGSDPQSAREPGTEELQADKAGSNFTIKTESHQDSKSYQEILKNATPSEEAVKSDRGDV